MINEYMDLKVGAIFRVNPGKGSHSTTPYCVEIIKVDRKGFCTKLHGEAPFTGIEPHIRRFDFNSPVWIEYHKKRFEKI